MSDIHLATGDLLLEPIRKGFGTGLLAAGKAHDNVVAVCADLTESTQMNLFAEAYPERFVDVGVIAFTASAVTNRSAARFRWCLPIDETPKQELDQNVDAEST